MKALVFKMKPLLALFSSAIVFSAIGLSPVRAPEFIGAKSDWLNGGPLAMSSLRGKVVLVDFWDLGCINCARTVPYLNKWEAKYRDKGLVIVGIHTPEFEFGHKASNVQAAIKKFGFQFPILIDNYYKNWGAYKNQYWPNKYLIDKDGKIVYDYTGEGDYEGTEVEIRKLLKQANPAVQLPDLK